MLIQQGFVASKDLEGVPVIVDIVDAKGAKNVRTLKKMEPIGVTVHNTGNTSASAGAKKHAKYLQNVEDADSTYVSWHFSVDDTCIVQHLPLYETGYHAGDGDGVGNGKTIGVEICENGNYEKAEANAVKLLRGLCDVYGWGIEAIKPHRYYSPVKKLCPHRILKSEQTWERDWADWVSKSLGVSVAPTHSSWASTGIQWALGLGLVSGSIDTVDWRETLTLERFLTILYRYGNNKHGGE